MDERRRRRKFHSVFSYVFQSVPLKLDVALCTYNTCKHHENVHPFLDALKCRASQRFSKNFAPFSLRCPPKRWTRFVGTWNPAIAFWCVPISTSVVGKRILKSLLLASFVKLKRALSKGFLGSLLNRDWHRSSPTQVLQLLRAAGNTESLHFDFTQLRPILRLSWDNALTPTIKKTVCATRQSWLGFFFGNGGGTE